MNQEIPPPAPPQSLSELIERLDAGIETLPKRLKQCAGFTRRHLHLVPVSTVSELARESGVAPSVYMRFCKALGFSGYSQMQDLLRMRITEFRPDYSQRKANLRQDGSYDTARLLAEFAEIGHRSLMSLANTVTNNALKRCTEVLAGARMVHLVGLRRAFAVVSNMAYLLDKLGIPAQVHHAAGMLAAESTILPGDVLVAITFAPFSDETIRLAELAAGRGALVLGVSDTSACPVAEWADEMLIVNEEEFAGFRALNAAITLTTALAVAASDLRERVDSGGDSP